MAPDLEKKREKESHQKPNEWVAGWALDFSDDYKKYETCRGNPTNAQKAKEEEAN
jgi:hypothetical protein